MLLQKQNLLEEGNKVILKLTTGDEIVCEIKTVSSDELVVTKAHRLAITHQGAGFVPFSLLIETDTNVRINRSQIVAYYELNKDVEKDFIRATSGIQLA